MTNWLKNLIGKVASQNTETNSEKEFERKIKANDWIDGVLKEDEAVLEKEAEQSQAEIEEVKGVKKESAYEMGDSEKDTIEKDYELRIKSLSDYNLAEMLHEFDMQDKGLATTVQVEAKDKMKKYVENNRTEAENKLNKLLGEHSKLDIKKAFEKFKENEEASHPKEEDLYKPEGPSGKQNWEKSSDYKTPSDKEKLEQMEGVGDEEEKGQVGKEASQKKKAESMFWVETDEGFQKPVEALTGTGFAVWQVTKDDIAQGFSEKNLGMWALENEGEVVDFYHSKEEAKKAVEYQLKTSSKKQASDVTDTIRKKVVKKIKDVIEEELDDKVVMEKEDAVEEHERLTDVLESPSHEDDKEEAVEQKEELEEYKEAKVTHSDTCERCKELYPSVCEVCKKDKANEIGDYRKEAKEDECARCEHPKSQHNEDGQCDKCLPAGNEHRFVKAQEIKPKVTKEAALKAMADAGDIWKVVENEKGEKLIAKVKKPLASNKESKDDENKDFLSGNKI